MSNSLFRAIVGQVIPLVPNDDTPVQYRQTSVTPLAPQVQGSAPSEPREATQLITENPENEPNPL